MIKDHKEGPDWLYYPPDTQLSLRELWKERFAIFSEWAIGRRHRRQKFAINMAASWMVVDPAMVITGIIWRGRFPAFTMPGGWVYTLIGDPDRPTINVRNDTLTPEQMDQYGAKLREVMRKEAEFRGL